MSATTSIEWTDRTWNPTTGCDKVSPGCAHCYAEGVAQRFWAKQYQPVPVSTPADLDATNTFHRPRQFTDVQTHEDRLVEPLSWRTPARVFVNSMSDLFHEDVPDEFIDKVFAVMALAPRHTFQVLTKRPERMRAYVTRLGRCIQPLETVARDMGYSFKFDEHISLLPWPIPNVWLGVSVENQRFATRIWELLKTPAAIRFVSLEPLLGPVDLDAVEALCKTWRRGLTIGTYLDWVIVGGESGPGARPFDLSWARSIVRQCRAAGVPVFVKQVGDNPVESGVRSRFKQSKRKGGALEYFPTDLQLREFPAVRA